ncbi:MAG TPA: sigma-70 family RNA polymerase sigma factor [Rhizomicrobium sp.]
MDADLRALEELIAELRPRLHRYCARMVGSAFEGEDVVQEALANAVAAWSEEIERPENWLFRVAHNAALDALRRRRRLSQFEAEGDVATIADPGEGADARVAAEASLAALQALTPIERSCVVLGDVLGYAADETASILSVTVASVKAALHRGRVRVREMPPGAPPVAIAPEERQRMRDYADKFNARDFDTLRALLAEDVRLDLANRVKLAGKKDVSVYFTRYAERDDYRVSLAQAEGWPVLVVEAQTAQGLVRYAVRLDWKDGHIAVIRDFRYAPYIMDSLAVRPLG